MNLKEQIAADMGLLMEAHPNEVKAMNIIVRISKTTTLLRPLAQDMKGASKTRAEKAMLNLYDAANEAEKAFVHSKAKYK